MSMYPEGIGGSKGMALLTINPVIKWKSVVSLMPGRLTAGERDIFPLYTRLGGSQVWYRDGSTICLLSDW
jgi:hypothetical protein